MREGDYFDITTVGIDVYDLPFHHFIRLLSLPASQMRQFQHASLSDGHRLLFFDVGQHEAGTVSHLAEHTAVPLIQNENHLDYHAVYPC